MEKPEAQIIGNPRRNIIKTVVTSILSEKGFETVEKQCLETLTEMMQACKFEKCLHF